MKFTYKAVNLNDTNRRCLHEHHTVDGARRCAMRLRWKGIACFDHHLRYIRDLAGKIYYERPELKIEKDLSGAGEYGEGGVLSSSKLTLGA